MRRASLATIVLAAATFSAGSHGSEVLPEFHRTLPNGLRVVTVAYPGAERVHLLLGVPAGSSAQPASLPGLAWSVARRKAAAVAGAGNPIEVSVGPRWATFALSGPAESLPELAERLGALWRADGAGAPPGGDVASTGELRCLDALRAALYPDHAYGRPVLPPDGEDEPPGLGMAGHYTPLGSWLAVVGAIDPFEASVTAGKSFLAWPVRGSPAVADPEHETEGGITLRLDAPGPARVLIGGRATGRREPAAWAALRVALEAAAASLERGRDAPTSLRLLEGGIWVAGPVEAGTTGEEASDRASAMSAVLDAIARGGITPEGAAEAKKRLLAAARRPAPGGGPVGFLELLRSTADASGGSPTVAGAVAGLDAVDPAAVDRMVRELFDSAARATVIAAPPGF